jgi:glutamate-1-semialdehyde 2,1-aminomutase
VPHVLQRAGNLFSVFIGPDVVGGVADFAQAQRLDAGAYARFFHSMLGQGVYLPPSAYEAWFVSGAHDAAVLERIAQALPAAARAAATIPPEPEDSA